MTYGRKQENKRRSKEERKIILGPQAPILASQVQVVPALPRSELMRRLEDDLHAVRALTHVLGAFDRSALMMRPRGRGRGRGQEA